MRLIDPQAKRDLAQYLPNIQASDNARSEMTSLNDRLKAILNEQAQNVANVPERPRIGRQEALYAGLAAALGRVFGARSAPQQFNQYIQNRTGMMDQDWQDQVQQENQRVAKLNALNQAKVQGLEIDRQMLGSDMERADAKNKEMLAAIQKQQDRDLDRYRIDETTKIQREQLDERAQNNARKAAIEERKLVPDAARDFEYYVKQGYSEDEAKRYAFANIESKISAMENADIITAERAELMKAQAKDTLSKTQWRPFEAQTRRTAAENMGIYQQGQLGIGRYNADTSRMNAETNYAQTMQQADSPIIKEKLQIIANLDKRLAELKKGAIEMGLLDSLGNRIMDESTDPVTVQDYLKYKKEVEKITNAQNDIRKRIEELRAPPQVRQGEIPPFNINGAGVGLGRIGG